MAVEDKKAVSIKVPVKDGDADEKRRKLNNLKIKNEELNEEEKKKKEELELLITRLKDDNPNVVNLSITLLNKEIIDTSGILTSSLFALKVLKLHYNTLIEIHTGMIFDDCKQRLSNMISALSTTIGYESNIVKYIIMGNKKDLINYGHEYIKNLTTKLIAEYKNIKDEEAVQNQYYANNSITTTSISTSPISGPSKGGAVNMMNHIHELVNIIVPYCFNHNTEYEAIDLLIEVDRINDICQYVDDKSCERSILYLLNLTHYSSSTEEYYKLMEVILSILKKHKKHVECLKILLRLNRRNKIKDLIFECGDLLICKQMALICSRHCIHLEFTQEEIIKHPHLNLNEISTLSSGEHLPSIFLKLAKDLDVEEPKLPEDIYKTHLEEKRNTNLWDSTKQNLSSSFVNAFVNAGFCKDKLMTVNSSLWIYKNKDHGIISATASMGLLLMWNIDEGLSQIDKFQYSNDQYVKAGSLIAFGLACTNVKNECDPAYALLSEHIDAENSLEKMGAILGFGYAYAGTNRENMLDVLIPPLVDNGDIIECSVFAALSLGLIFVGSQNREIAECIIDTVLERQKINNSLDQPISKLYAVALGLLFLCSREKCEATLAALEIIKHPISKYIIATVEGMAFAGSNDVLKVQKMLQLLVEKRVDKKNTDTSSVNSPTGDTNTANDTNAGANSGDNEGNNNSNNNSAPDSKKNNNVSTGKTAKKGLDGKTNISNSTNNQIEDNLDQCVAILNIALIALTDDISSEMTTRIIDHFLEYSNVHQKKAVPLALALLFTSFPKPNIVDILSKLTHDQDPDVALHAIISLGFVGAGTNNSRIAILLRQLSTFYYKDPNATFVIRLAQGLLYMGKGLLTINPLHSNRSIINNVALGSLLITIHACLQLKSTILGKYHYLLYHLAPCMYPRMLTTVNENLEPLPVSVRVGQAVDIVGQAGNPKTITGFQTHVTPVLMLHTDRAELATEEYIPINDTLEGIVILKKDPNYVPPTIN
ncbi:26S proteasome regulatory subunit RPN1, putative [Plasmodium berghei]|uniref:26S proteasome regulatory subunit RPN1, putative n=5 Tax=Plasmodium berghei TaxID=5821 RepID=A0A509AF33_PLABA|nr:26S proteasome regulatory subunit RPN1, putative [Plasmodium berghei ANKA]CXH92729.1 26S proteasome regulatory subunit RPN1, putative [Plasmodium berghei]SCL90704.1 26S proteasome regulatory subunit RPN1, putative [Plasmodium berghei]SCM15336.1 26S proteasome regulatory subunit RPN1, putative [Plasmodium berghei]SCM17129.1 26S proteasome regulatory subunit RPN1, putative [Plasmodium berghei]SCN22124.1 26S proteasome regulatory subunit RPN1, putative [Plasmodium berghei]|eukprot:XP_034419920.1 26S proteasome regulatory subunit RPN1, putative [Plasmodium berghei ANKA]